MAVYSFSLAVSGLAIPDRRLNDAYYAMAKTGSDFSAISFDGREVLVDFDIEAPSLQAAVERTTTAIRKAGLTVDRVEPDDEYGHDVSVVENDRQSATGDQRTDCS